MKKFTAKILRFHHIGDHGTVDKNESKTMTMNTINARLELKRKLAAREHVLVVGYPTANHYQNICQSRNGFCSY